MTSPVSPTEKKSRQCFRLLGWPTRGKRVFGLDSRARLQKRGGYKSAAGCGTTAPASADSTQTAAGEKEGGGQRRLLSLSPSVPPHTTGGTNCGSQERCGMIRHRSFFFPLSAVVALGFLALPGWFAACSFLNGLDVLISVLGGDGLAQILRCDYWDLLSTLVLNPGIS